MNYEDVKRKIRGFLLERGGPFRITEMDHEINDLNRELIQSLHEEFPGNVLLTQFRDNKTEQYNPDMKVFNFDWDAVRVPKEKITELLIWV
jgi:hypothetical protein